MLRRTAIKLGTIGLLSAGLSPLTQTLPAASKRKAHPRIACSSATFRDFFESHPITDVAAYFANELGISNVEIWAKHIETHPKAALEKLRSVIESHGSYCVNIQLDGPKYNLSAPSDDARAASIQLVKEWMDRAALLGCSSLRPNTGGGKTFDLKLTADSFHQLADYGEKIGIKVLIENHGGHSKYVENITAIINEVKSAHCGSLPDFGNVPATATQAEREAFIAQLIPSAHIISAKFMNFDAKGVHTPYDIAALVRKCESLGYYGMYSLEQYSKDPLTRDRLKACREVIQIIEANLTQ